MKRKLFFTFITVVFAVRSPKRWFLLDELISKEPTMPTEKRLSTMWKMARSRKSLQPGS